MRADKKFLQGMLILLFEAARDKIKHQIDSAKDKEEAKKIIDAEMNDIISILKRDENRSETSEKPREKSNAWI